MKKIIISVFLAATSLCFCASASATDSIGVVDGRLANILEPINDNEAATKKYVDDSIAMIPEVPAILQTLGQSETAIVSQKGISEALQAMIDVIYPVGAIFMSVNSANPEVLFSGIWERWGDGRVAVGVSENNSNFNISEKIGGTETVALGTSNIPNHTHQIVDNTEGWVAAANGAATNGYVLMTTNSAGARRRIQTTNSGGSNPVESHNNLQPYITCYMWKRIA